MWTRQDYMNGRCTHSEYYAQFITPEIQSAVLNTIPTKRIVESKDPHFNDIAMKHWDSIFGIVGPPQGPFTIYRQFGLYKKLKEHGDGLSCASAVCIAKEFARQVRNSYQEAT
jgi:hypothetical protein